MISDAALVRSAMDPSDTTARDALFRRWSPIVWRWCARLGGPWVDPEEAAQEALIRVFQKLSTLADPDAFPAFCFAITRRVLAGHRRRAWWRRWVPGAAPERSSASNPERDTGRAELAAAMRALLEDLPAEQREVVVLCAVEQRTTREASVLLGVPEGTVKSRNRLASERLRTAARTAGLDATLTWETP